MSDLAHYSQQIEQLYTDLRRFRHDYLNILSSIKYGIDSGYGYLFPISTITCEKQRLGLRKQYEIANLINIKDEAVKGVLASKILEAQGQSITVTLRSATSLKYQMEIVGFHNSVVYFFFG